METPFYLYRSSTEKLAGHLQHIEESGDEVISPQFVGGRDWIVVCRKTPLPQPRREAAR